MTTQETYGIFVWSGGTGKYAKAEAIRTYKNAKAAQAFADKHLDQNYVVRRFSLLAN